MKYFVITKDESIRNERDDWQVIPVAEISRGLFSDKEEAQKICDRLNKKRNEEMDYEWDDYSVKEIRVRKTSRKGT